MSKDRFAIFEILNCSTLHNIVRFRVLEHKVSAFFLLAEFQLCSTDNHFHRHGYNFIGRIGYSFVSD